MAPLKEPTPVIVDAFAALLGLAAVLTGYAGLSAAGFLVPAATLLLLAALIWAGRAKYFVIAVDLTCIVAGAGQDLVVALGDELGRLKLDIAGVLLLIHLLCGGPLAALIGVPLLGAMRWSKALSAWFDRSADPLTGAAQ